MTPAEPLADASRVVASWIGPGEPISWAVVAPPIERRRAAVISAIALAVFIGMGIGFFGLGRYTGLSAFGRWDLLVVCAGLPILIAFLRASYDWLRGGHEYYAITPRRLLIAGPSPGQVRSYMPGALNSIYVEQTTLGSTNVHFRQEDRVVGGYDRVVKLKLHRVKDAQHVAELLRALRATAIPMETGTEVPKERLKPV